MIEKHEDPEERIENALGRTESFIMEHGKKMLLAVVAVVVLVGAWMLYKNVWQVNRGEKASAMMYVAQQNLAQQMWDAALNGDGNNAGFLAVISQFGGTPEGNLARHYAGVCQLQLGQFDEALKSLSSYKAVSGVPAGVIDAENIGLQGDIYVQKGDFARAADFFARAAKTNNDPFTTPLYLKKQGLALAAAGQGEQAIEAYQRILDDFPASMEAQDIEKYIGAASL